MKSHRLCLNDLLLFVGLDDLLLLELKVPPFLPFDPLEFSPFSDSKHGHFNYSLQCSTANLLEYPSKPHFHTFTFTSSHFHFHKFTLIQDGINNQR